MIKEYHLPDGNPVTVNLAAVAYVQRTADQTLITFIGGAMLTVVEPYEQVSGAHTPERQVGFGIGSGKTP